MDTSIFIPTDIYQLIINFSPPTQFQNIKMICKASSFVKFPKIHPIIYHIVTNTMPFNIAELRNDITNNEKLMDIFIDIINDSNFNIGNKSSYIINSVLSIYNYRDKQWIKPTMKLETIKALYKNDKYIFNNLSLKKLMNYDIDIDIIDYMLNHKIIVIDYDISYIIIQSKYKYVKFLLNKFSFNCSLDNVIKAFQYGNYYVFSNYFNKCIDQLKQIKLPIFVKSTEKYDEISYINCIKLWIQEFGLNKSDILMNYNTMKYVLKVFDYLCYNQLEEYIKKLIE